MNKQDYIIDIYKYFSRFVPKTVLTDLFSQTTETKKEGYDELVSDMLNQSDDLVFPGIGTFIVSADRKYVEDKISNSKGFVLFVEYGEFSYNPLTTDGVSEKIGINLCRDFNFSNNDNLNEALLMNECNNVLNAILNQMQTDQTELNSCGYLSLIKFPADIYPIAPETFYGRSGWAAMFENSKEIL